MTKRVTGAAAPPLITDPASPGPSRRLRLVILDLDGTCLDEDQRLHPRTRTAVRETASRMPVVIATGRMYPSTARWARELNVTQPIICYQGAVVRELPDGAGNQALGRLLFEDGLAPDAAVRALHLARANGWHYQAYRDERLLCEEDRPEAHLYARIAQTAIHLVGDLEPVVRQGTVKALCVVDDGVEVLRCERLMRAELGDGARVVRSLPPFVEITSPSVSKSKAALRICDRLGIDPGETLAVGDAPNDADLLAMAGFAVAVEGSPPVVLSEADALCGPPHEGGVADVLRTLGLGSG